MNDNQEINVLKEEISKLSEEKDDLNNRIEMKESKIINKTNYIEKLNEIIQTITQESLQKEDKLKNEIQNLLEIIKYLKISKINLVKSTCSEIDKLRTVVNEKNVFKNYVFYDGVVLGFDEEK